MICIILHFAIMQTKHNSAEMCVKYAKIIWFHIDPDADEWRCICLINNVTSCALFLCLW